MKELKVNHLALVKKAILYDIFRPNEAKENAKSRLEETKRLLETYGGITLLEVIQRRHHSGSTSFIGKGKLKEILEKSLEIGANLFILNSSLSSSQIYKIEEDVEKRGIKDFEVWDRVELILNIFKKHASTKAAKLQLELAKIDYMGPRIYRMGLELSQQGGGIGTRGAGETNTEMMKRHLARYKKNVLEGIEQLKRSRDLNKRRRKEKGFKNVSIVGYTNAGKSLLFQKLCRKQTLVRDELFATLDTKVGRLYFEEDKEFDATVTDTIGFISDLPVELVSAFKSTLEETVDADLLLHVVDVSDKERLKKIEVVEKMIDEITLGEIPVLYVFNKVDQIESLEEIPKLADNIKPILVSAKLEEGFQTLKAEIKKFFEKQAP